MKDPIYLDYAATTPVDPRVAEDMMNCLTQEGNFGNPASRSHIYGWRAEEAVEQARRQVADLINADLREIVWTSGATESNNLAVKGIAHFKREKGRHIVTSAIEHKSVLDTCAYLESEGFDITYLQPNTSGIVESKQIAKAITDKTILVSIMHVNNELGSVNNIKKIGDICCQAEVIFHVDAAQSAGKIAIDVVDMSIDLLSLSSHKFYGPKGIGILFVRRTPDIKIPAQIHGGGHERGMRSGTLPTHQIVGMGSAAALALIEQTSDYKRISAYAEKFVRAVTQIEGIGINGIGISNAGISNAGISNTGVSSVDELDKYPGIVNLHFSGREGETMLMALRGLAISSGSACTSASVEPSYVIKAIGVDEKLADSSLRFSFGRYTTEEDVNKAIKIVNKLY